MRALRQVSVHKEVCCEQCILQCKSGAFRDDSRSLLSWATGHYTGQCLFSLLALSMNLLGLRSRASKRNGDIKIAHQYIDVGYLPFPSLTAVSVGSEVP